MPSELEEALAELGVYDPQLISERHDVQVISPPHRKREDAPFRPYEGDF